MTGGPLHRRVPARSPRTGCTTTDFGAASLVVSEIFTSIQGEGPSAGRRCSFVRLGGCNLTCTWCDAAYTWDARRHDLRKELTRLPVAQITDRVADHDTGMVVITGGEPLLHQRQPAWRDLVTWLHRQAYRIEVETNATIIPDDWTAARVTAFNTSPKLANSGVSLAKRRPVRAMAVFARLETAVFKFVCATAADVAEAATVVEVYRIPPHRVWIMPEGATTVRLADSAAAVVQPAIDRGFNVSARMQIDLWGGERGR